MALPLAFGNTISARRKQKKLDKMIDNRPKYKITDEAFENQAIARGEAYGRDRAIQGQEAELEQDASDAVGQAKDVTSSTSALMSTIAAINANKDQSRRELATTEAQLMAGKKSQLLDVNTQMIDEKDKAWNYNENMPYQMKVAALRDRIKNNQEQAAQQYAASSNFMTNMFAGGSFNYGGGSSGGDKGGGGMGGGMGMALSDERTKKKVINIEHGMDELMQLRPVEFKYKWSDEPHLGFIAQEIQKVLPQVVVVDEDTSQEYLKIKLHEIIPVLVKSMQEMQLQIQQLREEMLKPVV